MKEVGVPEETKIFVGLSLCPYYKIMWSKSQKLLMGENSVFYIFNSAIRKLHEMLIPNLLHMFRFLHVFSGRVSFSLSESFFHLVALHYSDRLHLFFNNSGKGKYLFLSCV